MSIILLLLFGMVLFLTLISGALGFLCTDQKRSWIPGLIFGVPILVANLLILALFSELRLIWVNSSAALGVILGSTVVWRGFRTGKTSRDYWAAAVIGGGILLLTLVLVYFPELPRAIIQHFVPTPPIL